MPLTDDERKQAEASILEDLDREHARRLDALDRKRERLRTRRDHELHLQHEHEVAELREELRARYYTERGYRLYVDSRGRESWLTPEEYEWRTKYRRRRKRNQGLVGFIRKIKPDIAIPKGRAIWTWAVYLGMMVLAVVLGVALSR